MKKFLAVVLCMCMLSVSVSAASLQLDIGSTEVRSVTDTGFEKKQMETAPFTVNGRTMVPVRVIAENFGAQVGWDEATQTVTVSVPERDISLVLGSSEAVVNGESVALDVPATEQNGRTLVPLRFITETFGYHVKYLPSTQQIYITDSPIVLQSAHSFVTFEEFCFVYNLYKDEYVPTAEAGASEAEILNAKAACASQLCDVYASYYSFYDYLVYTAGSGIPAAAAAQVQQHAAQNVSVLDAMQALNVHFNAYSELIYTGDVYAESLMQSVPEEALQSAYEKDYIAAKHILIPTVNLQTLQPLSEQETLAAEALAQDLCAQLANGADFDALMHEYSEDGGLVANPDGYVFTAGEMVEEFYQGALALQIGEVSAPVQSVFGYHIIKREPLPEMSETIRAELLEPVVFEQMDSIYESHPMQLVMAPETLISMLP